MSILIAFGIYVIWAVAGRQLADWIGFPRLGRIEGWVISLALGCGAFLTIFWFLGLLGQFHALAAWTLLAIGLALGWRQVPPLFKDIIATLRALCSLLTQAPWMVRLLVVACVAQAAVHMVADMAPPIEADTLHTYLLVPRYWASSGRYYHPSHLGQASLPMLMLVSNAFGLMAWGEALAQILTGAAMGVAASMAVYSIARVFTERQYAILSATIFYLIPSVWWISSSAKVDLGWTFFDLVAIWAFVTFLSRRGKASVWLLVAGLMIGFSMNVKFMGIYSGVLIPVFLIGVSLLRGTSLRQTGRHLGWYLLGLLITVFPSYLYNLLQYRNPVYPLFTSLFADLWGGTITQPGVALGEPNPYSGLVGYITVVWDMSLRPGFAYGMSYLAGPLIIAFVPVAVLLRRRWKSNLALLGLYSIGYSMLWFLGVQRTRHFLPALGLLSIISACGLLWLHGNLSKLGRAMLACTVLLLVVFQTWSLNRHNLQYRVPTALGLIAKEEYVRIALDQRRVFASYDMTSFINARLPLNARIVSLHEPHGYYIMRDYIRHTWIDGYDAASFEKPQTFAEFLAQHSITHVLINDVIVSSFKAGDFWLPHRPTLFEDPAFQTKYMRLIYEDGQQRLYEFLPED